MWCSFAMSVVLISSGSREMEFCCFDEKGDTVVGKQ